MIIHQKITALLFALALARIELSTCQVVRAKVSCLDCNSQNDDLSGVKVLVKCDQGKKLAMVTTKEDGSFEAKLPSYNEKTRTSTPSNCFAKLLGGQNQLFASKKHMVSQIVTTQEESNSYTTSNPLAFYKSCSSTIKQASCETMKKWGSSKTVDLPLPPEWGLAPSSYYVPFFPIIGIP
ncbi:hypothetical protein UlMin_017612 [Ulmus minor]